MTRLQAEHGVRAQSVPEDDRGTRDVHLGDGGVQTLLEPLRAQVHPGRERVAAEVVGRALGEFAEHRGTGDQSERGSTGRLEWLHRVSFGEDHAPIGAGDVLRYIPGLPDVCSGLFSAALPTMPPTMYGGAPAARRRSGRRVRLTPPPRSRAAATD